MWEVEHVFGIKESAETQRKGENHIRDIFLEKKTLAQTRKNWKEEGEKVNYGYCLR